MKQRVKAFAKDAMGIGIAGIGLSAVSGLGGGAAVGKLSGSLGTIGGIAATGHIMGMLSDIAPKKKKRY